MKKMGVQLVHSIYGETEQAQLAEVADTSGSAAASQLHVLVIIKLGLLPDRTNDTATGHGYG